MSRRFGGQAQQLKIKVTIYFIMKFSVIVPALNEQEFIVKCINSIKNQTISPYEVIVVDNGSTDKTAEISEKLGCRVVKEKKRGLSHARNKGARVAQGDILCFFDADGIVSKNWLKQATRALSNRKVMAVVGLNVVTHENLAKHVWYNTETLFNYLGIFFRHVLFNQLFLGGNRLAIRKEIFWKLGGFEPVIGESYWLSKKFWKLNNRKGVFDPKMVVYYSSRGYEASGYLRMILYWSKHTFLKTSQKGYTYKTKI